MNLLDRIAAEGRAQKAQGVPAFPSSGPALRDEALDRVERNANPNFKAAALDAVRQAAESSEAFTTDRIWFLLGDKASTTHERRAMGAVMQAAAKRGWCVATNETRPSVRPDCHARPVRVWRSLLFQVQAAA